MPRGGSSGNRRARASARRRPKVRWVSTFTLFAVAALMASMSGALAFFLPAVMTAFASTGQAVTPPFVPGLSSPSPVAAQVGPFTVLLLGSDDDQKFDPAHVLTQSMILVRVVPATQQVTMLSIPRDLWVPLSTGGTAKIDGAYSYGGPAAAIATVERNFNVHVDEYVWVGLKGLIRLIDALGGVDVVASNPVTDDYYPRDIDSNNPYGYMRVAVLPGPQHLDGTNALQYVRSRHGDLEGDFGRSQRQQQVLLAIRQKSKLLSPEDLPAIASAIGGELKTSIGISEVAALLPLAASFDNPDQIRQIVLLPPYTHGGGPGGSVTANWDLILPVVHQYFP